MAKQSPAARRAPATATSSANCGPGRADTCGAGFLARIWCEVLGAPASGADDDFFDIGSDSLLAMEVAARIREQLRREVPLRAL